MKYTEFTITEIIDGGEDSFGQTAWLKVKDQTGFKIAFWGSPRDIFVQKRNMKNIEMIKASKLPIKIKISSEHDYAAEKYEREKYQIEYSVGECAPIEIIKLEENE